MFVPEKFNHPVPLYDRDRDVHRSKLAPDPDFDFNLPPNCRGVCLGSCHNGPCPFLGCQADASAYGPTRTRH